MAFYDNDDEMWQGIELFIDLVFFIDIVFSFFSAYYNKSEALVFLKREIAIAYLKTWFAVDFVSILPLSYLTNSTVNQLGDLARFPRIYKIAKTAK